MRSLSRVFSRYVFGPKQRIKQPFEYTAAFMSDLNKLPQTNIQEAMENGIMSHRYQLNQFLHEKYGDIVLMPAEQFGQNMVAIFHPDTIKKVFENEGPTPTGSAPLTFPFQKWATEANRTDTVGSAYGKEWKRLRGIFQKNLVNPRDAQGYYPLLAPTVDQCVREMPKHADCMHELMPRITFDLFNTLLLGQSLNVSQGQASSVDNEYVANALKVFTLLNELMTIPEEVYAAQVEGRNTPKYDEFYNTMESLMARGTELLGDAMERLSDGDEATASSYMGHRLRQAAKDDVSFETLRNNLIGFLFAGVDTTSNTLQFLLYNIANNPNVQDQIRDQIYAQLGSDKPCDSEEANKIPLLRQATKETYRLTPPASGAARIIESDIELEGYNIPANTFLMMSPSPYMWSEDVFPDPMEFNPSRWDRHNMKKGTLATNPYLIMPFGKGKRMCIGSRVAEVEATSLFCRILQLYRVTLAPDSPTPLVDTTSAISRPIPTPKYVFEPLTS